MEEHKKSPQEEGGNDTNNAIELHKGSESGDIMQSVSLEDLQSIEPDEAIPHYSQLLELLLEQFAPIDFELLAFPQAEGLRKALADAQSKEDEEGEREILKKLDKLKLNQKHLLVLGIENTLSLAEKNNWGLCKNLDFIFLYNGAFWVEVDKEAFQKFLGEAAEKMGVAKFSARYYQFREHLFRQFLATAYLPTPEADKDKVLINLQNGTFEVTPQGNKLRAFDRNDFVTYQLPFEYDPECIY